MVIVENPTITHHDLKWVNGGGGKVQKACDSWLDEIMGTPTVHEDSHLVMINAFENTKGLSGWHSR